MASEMGLAVVSKKELKRARKPTIMYKVSASSRVSISLSELWSRALRGTKPKLPLVDVRKGKRKRAIKKLPTVKQLAKKVSKKRRRRHVERTGKTMRKLRKINGVKVFSFPDNIWKVKKKKRKRRK